MENVRYFDDFAAARAAGFRACKRCAPQDVAADAESQRLVVRACALLDSDDAPGLAQVAQSLGVSRFHFQRMFRGVAGLTPGEYRRARREGRLRRGLERGASVTEAIQAAGYGSASRAYEAAPLGMAPSVYREGGRGERLTYAIADSSLGKVLAARSRRGLCTVALGDDDTAVIDALRRRLPHAELAGNDAELADRLRAVVAVVEDDDASSAVLTMDIRIHAFKRRIWKALRDVDSSGTPRSRAGARALCLVVGEAKV